jgi:hypothetical protein
MDKFIEKQNDKVVNVRIVMARYCGEFLSNFVEPDHSETSSEKSIDITEEDKSNESDNSNIERNRLQYERLLNEKKFMKMIVRLKNDDKLDVSSQITENVNFDKLMSFIKQNEHRVEDIDLFED